MARKRPFKPFRSAHKEAKTAKKITINKQTASPSYKLAFTDTDFLLKEALRPVRLQLELLKPEMIQQEHHIHSTIVVFGSARIVESKIAKKRLKEAKLAAKAEPNNPILTKQVQIAEKILEKSHYYDEARSFASLVSAQSQHEDLNDFVIITGGGPGIMEAANRGAYEVNAQNIALNVILPHEQVPNKYITPELSFQFHYFAIRKMHFLIRAKALVAFPGGFGTLDELFEALTLLQTRKIVPIPIILFGQAYWEKIINFQAMVDEGVIKQEDLSLFRYCEHAEDAWAIIKDFYKAPDTIKH